MTAIIFTKGKEISDASILERAKKVLGSRKDTRTSFETIFKSVYNSGFKWKSSVQFPSNNPAGEKTDFRHVYKTRFVGK
jgi:hypothetical protein